MSYQPYGKRKRYESYGMEAEDSSGGFNLNGLVLYMKLESELDSKNGILWTNRNGVIFSGGKVANAANFNGTDKAIHSSNSIYAQQNTDFTVCAWAKLNSKPANAMVIFCKGNFSTGIAFDFTFNWNVSSDKFQMIVSDGTNLINGDTAITPTIGVWYFLLLEYVKAIHTGNWYVNNILSTSLQNNAFNPTDQGFPIVIGQNADLLQLRLDGQVDEVSFWRRLLTPQEKTFLYNGGSGRSLL